MMNNIKCIDCANCHWHKLFQENLCFPNGYRTMPMYRLEKSDLEEEGQCRFYKEKEFGKNQTGFDSGTLIMDDSGVASNG